MSQSINIKDIPVKESFKNETALRDINGSSLWEKGYRAGLNLNQLLETWFLKFPQVTDQFSCILKARTLLMCAYKVCANHMLYNEARNWLNRHKVHRGSLPQTWFLGVINVSILLRTHAAHCQGHALPESYEHLWKPAAGFLQMPPDVFPSSCYFLVTFHWNKPQSLWQPLLNLVSISNEPPIM